MADAAAAAAAKAAAAEWRESYEMAKEKQVFVYEVRVDGANRTRPELIDKLLSPLRDAEGERIYQVESESWDNECIVSVL